MFVREKEMYFHVLVLLAFCGGVFALSPKVEPLCIRATKDKEMKSRYPCNTLCHYNPDQDKNSESDPLPISVPCISDTGEATGPDTTGASAALKATETCVCEDSEIGGTVDEYIQDGGPSFRTFAYECTKVEDPSTFRECISCDLVNGATQYDLYSCPYKITFKDVDENGEPKNKDPTREMPVPDTAENPGGKPVPGYTCACVPKQSEQRRRQKLPPILSRLLKALKQARRQFSGRRQ